MAGRWEPTVAIDRPSEEVFASLADVAGMALADAAGVGVRQMTEHLRRRRVDDGRDVDQEERRQCGCVDSRAGATR
jgi:hypothetical protein